MRRLLLAVVLLLTGCTSGPATDEPTTSPSSSQPPTVTTSEPTAPTPATSPPYLPVPKKVTLTEPGSNLRFGDPAVVAWRAPRRNNRVAVVELSVDRVARVDLSALGGWKLNRRARRSTPYYVQVSARSLSRTDVSGLPVPLYAVNQDDALVQAASFAGTFVPCPSGPFPDGLKVGRKPVEVCLLFLIPRGGRLAAVAFRPSARFNPINWTGPIKQPDKRKRKR